MGNLIPENKIRLPQGVQLFLSHLANHANSQSRPRERLTHYQIFRQIQLPAQLPYFILKQQPQRLDNLLKIHIIRQTAHIMMTLNHRRITRAGFNYIWINRTLDQIIHLANFFRLCLKDANEFLANNLAFPFRLRYSGQF